MKSYLKQFGKKGLENVQIIVIISVTMDGRDIIWQK